MPRGRPPAHTRDQVIDAAVAIADAEGLAAVTMRRIAGEIGAGAMSLYTYVPDKDRLLDLMVDRVGGAQPLPRTTGDWRTDLLALANHQRALMRRHPWLPAALPNRRLTGTNTLAYLERGLAALAPTDLAGSAKMEIVALLTGFVAGYVTNELAQAQATVTTADQIEHLTTAVATGNFPHLAAVLAASANEQPSPPDFERIAARMIAGLVGIKPV